MVLMPMETTGARYCLHCLLHLVELRVTFIHLLNVEGDLPAMEGEMEGEM